MGPELLAGEADGYHFGMGGRVLVGHYPIAGGGEDFSVFDNDASERPARLFDNTCLAHQFYCFEHIRSIFFCGHDLNFITSGGAGRQLNIPLPGFQGTWAVRL
jgi:hypothetical protein